MNFAFSIDFFFTFAAAIEKTMGYGVMVTLQILVLSFLVRARVPQLKISLTEADFFHKKH